MEQYTEQEYKAKFGDKMWQEKVITALDGGDVESVYATSNGNIFMIMKKEEL